MEYYIKILPKNNVSTYSKYSFDKSKILDFKIIKEDEYGTPYNHGGYVKCFYGENEFRYIVYRNLPNFGNVKGKFKTLEDACRFIEEVIELESEF